METAHPASVERFRAQYRREHMPNGYRGGLHLAATTSISLGIIASCIANLDAVTALEWLALPGTFLYANLAEYLGHRGPMHHRRRGLGLVFERHARQHHRFFTADAMPYDTPADLRAVLFPVVLLLFFLLAFTVPAALLLAWLASANVAWLFGATAVAYFLNYELLHLAYHAPAGSWVQRLPAVARLRRLHAAHHDPALMQRHNFNITYPICDWLFGTLLAAEHAAAPARPLPQGKR